MNAAIGTAQAPPARVAIAITAPSPAPLDKPSRYGSASGFLIIAWRAAPQTPRLPPTRNASITRGARRSLTIDEAWEPPFQRPFHTALSGSGTAPALRPTRMHAMTSIARATPRDALSLILAALRSAPGSPWALS